MRDHKFFIYYALLASCLFMLLLSGCLPWAIFVKEPDPDDDPETADVELKADPETPVEYDAPAEIELEMEPAEEAEEFAEAREPYNYHEFGLESLGLTKNMNLDEVIALLGDPLSIEKHDGMGPHTTLHYDGLSLSFDQGLQYFNLRDPAIIGARGIRVGDPVETVLNSYLQENEGSNLWTNPEAADRSDLSDRCVELYYFEPDDDGLVKTGIIYGDEITGAPVRITYSHYLPYSCGYSGITFFIDDGFVTEIRREGF